MSHSALSDAQKGALPGSASAPPPLARWVSEAARRTFETEVQGRGEAFASIAEARLAYDFDNRRRLEVMRGIFPVQTRALEIAGVPVELVVPAGRDPVLRPAEPVLICLHGGAFAWGGGAGALLEAVPIAAVSGLPVLAVDYRMAPEHRHPAATEDVAALYEALLIDRASSAIGLFGCSAGGALVAQSVARFQSVGLPRPGAIAMLHAAGLELGGDLLALAPFLNADDPAAGVFSLAALPYFEGSDPGDPLVFPGDHPEVVSAFPPSLLITATRDFAASSVSVMHRRLLAQGVEAEFILFDGLWHAFHMSGELPESRELYDRVSNFFLRRLG
jgi:monoterpene epsilon-lactone hydrolase